MKAKCQKILEGLSPIDQEAINAAIERAEGAVGAMSPQDRAALAKGAVADHLANLKREREAIVGQIPQKKKSTAEERAAAKEKKAAERRAQLDLFNALKDAAILPAIASDSADSFRAKLAPVIEKWRGEDPARADIALPDTMYAALQREAKRAAKERADAEKERAKLRNTGVDLRRSWELEKAELKAKDEAEGITALNRILAKTTRADLFAGITPEDATPGTRRYVDAVRANVYTFKDWLLNGWKAPFSDLYGEWTTGQDAKLEAFVRGTQYMSGTKLEEAMKLAGMSSPPANSRSLTVQERIDIVAAHADHYLATVRPVVQALSGSTKVEEAAEALRALIWQSDPVGNESYFNFMSEKYLTGEGARLAESGIWDNSGAGQIHPRGYKARTIAGNQAIADENQRKKPLVPPKLENVERSGLPEVRKGDVTPQQFKEKFGFGDVGFGSWVKTGEDQAHLNHAWDAFSDLAAHLGIEPRHMGFGGRLHFTLGALGHGSKAAAHFSPNHPGPEGRVAVINLTKTKGDGTVGHEWFHAWDHFMRADETANRALNELVDTLKVSYNYEALHSAAISGLTKNSYIVGQKRAPPLENAENLINYYKRRPGTSQYKRNADVMDPKYWGNDKELPARAFEAWLADSLGGIDNYLVNPGWVGEGMATTPTYKGTPYPMGDERKRFGRWFKALAAATTFDDAGQPKIDRVKWAEVKPTDKADYWDAAEKLIADLPALQAQMEREEDMKAAQRKADAIATGKELERQAKEKEAAAKAAAEAAAAQAREALVTAPPPVDIPAATELSVNDLEQLFDLAAESVRADPDKAEPGAAALEAEPDPEEDADDAPWKHFTPAGRRQAFAEAGRKDPEQLSKMAWHYLKPADKAVLRAAMKREQTGAEPVPPTAQETVDASAKELLGKATKEGVKAFDEAMTALTKLFGAGRLQSFPGGFDEETYKAAKPHFEAALKSLQEAGKTLLDLFKHLVERFGEGVKPYAIRFAKDMKLTAELGTKPSASMEVATWVRGQLNRPGAETGAPSVAIYSKELFEKANAAWGGSQAEGKYTPKDAYDAAEAGMNLWILENAGRAGLPMDTNAAGARVAVKTLSMRTGLMPTQSKRTGEQDEFQQFSTVPALAYLANWVANVRQGEVMGEPSAGVGGIASFAKALGARVVANELSSRRAAVLREVLPDARVFTENAEQIGNILPEDSRPSVIVMNPPFSATAGRIEGQRDTMTGAKHIESALTWLKPGGRLVAIVGKGMAEGEPRFKPWWDKVKAQHNVRAILSLNGEEYGKYGTTYDNVLLVIDKTGPTKGAVITGRAEAYSEVPALLEGVRNDRTEPLASDSAPQQPADQPQGGAAAPANVGEPGVSPRADAGTVGDQRGDLPGTRGSGRGGRGSGAARGDGAGDGGRRGRRGAAPDGAGQPGAGGSGQLDLGNDQRPDERVELDAAANAARAELTDSIFETYTPLKARVKGSKAHPGKLVESAAMSAVEPPDVTYTPNLPREAIEGGRVSDAQLEAAIYAGQAHSEILPNGDRRGYFVGDGTGVGKGREISAIILDNMRQGRKKAVWLSASAGLIRDAKRDFGGVAYGFDEKDAQSKVTEIFGLRDVGNGGASPSGKITRGDGIAFVTYDTLKGGEKGLEAGLTPQTSLNQLVEWLGPDFDGVLAFDESHKMKNLGNVKGKRGAAKPSQRALVAQELRVKLPKARIVYVSATGATEVANLAYADRLGLWGANTAFTDANDFTAKVGAAGLAAMELVARDMKAMGVYISRSLSYDGVEQTTIDASFTPLQKEIYDELARAWQIVLKNVNAAMETTGAKKNGQAKSYALSNFWSSQQRFFNQVITAMMTPSVTDFAREQIAQGHTVLFQLVNTNEATQERLVEAAAAEETPLEELDFSPKQVLIQFLKKAFPVQAYEEYMDDNGKIRSRPVQDSQGNPVIDKEAEAKRDALIEHVDKNLRVPENPLDLVYEALGENNVGEVTGRGRRFTRVQKKDGSYTLEERKRTGKSNEADAKAFMDDKKKALVFTDAGGTGYSFHSDRGAKNQRRRIHILLQPGWVAENAMQGIGRSHRSNEVNQPVVALPKSDLKAQKRFISSIARRLDQLGALTKGQRNAASQGLFTNRDNLESKYAAAALRQLLEEMAPGRRGSSSIENSEELISAMGLEEIYDEGGNIAESKMPPIQRFLNRLLSLTTSQQDTVFTEFEMRMDAAIEAAVKQGTYDDGMQTVRALAVKKLRDEVVHVDERSKAATRYIELELTQKTQLNDWQRVQNELATYGRSKPSAFYFDNTTGQPFAVVDLGNDIDARGQARSRGYRYDVVAAGVRSRGRYVTNRDAYERGGDPGRRMRDEAGRLVTVDAPYRGSAADAQAGVTSIQRYRKIGASEAEYLWNAAFEEAPKTFTEPMHLLTGALLPVWDRIAAGDSDATPSTVSVVRTQTDEGERLIGRVVAEDDRAAILKNLGVGALRGDITASELIARIMGGEKAQLSNGWLIEKKRVSNDTRLEIIASYLSPGDKRLLQEQGAFIERIQWQDRVFIPTGNEEAFERLTRGANRPVVDFIKKDEPKYSEAQNATAPRAERAKGLPLNQLREAIQRATGKALPADAFVRRPLPDGVAPAIAALEKAWGVRVVPFVNNAPEIFQLNGVHIGDDALYVNVEGQYPLLQVVGHELTHEMRKRAPHLYRSLQARVAPLLQNVEQYRTARLSNRADASPDLVEEEMIADLVGENFTRPEFWKALAAREPTLGAQLARWILDFINRVIQTVRGAYRADDYVRDLTAAREAIVTAMADFAADTSDPDTALYPRFSSYQPVWYSELARQVAASPTTSAPAQQWIGTLKGMKGVKAEELEATGILMWLEAKGGKVTRAEISKYLARNGVRLEETELGGEKSAQRIAEEQRQQAALTAEYQSYLREFPELRDLGDAHEARIALDRRRQALMANLANEPTPGLRETYAKIMRQMDYLGRFINRWENIGTPAGRADAIIVQLDQLGFTPTYDHGDGTILTLKDRNGVSYPGSDLDELEDGERPFDDLPEEVQSLVAEHAHIVMNDDAEEAPFENYTLPGGSAYRVMLIRLPTKKAARESMGKPERMTVAEARERILLDLEDPQVSHVLVYPQANDSYISELAGGRYRVDTPEQTRDFARLAEAEAFLLNAFLIPEAGWQPSGTFQSGHFGQPNIVAHVRTKDRTDEQGRKVLFIEEVQSDWAQRGKRDGFAREPVPKDAPLVARHEEAPGGNYWSIWSEDGVFITNVMPYDLRTTTDGRKTDEELALIAGRERLEQGRVSPQARGQGVPTAPFVGKTEAWVALAMKRAIRFAADNGYEAIAWTTGAQQVARYSLRHVVESIDWYPGGPAAGSRPATPAGTKVVFIDTKGGATKLFQIVAGPDGVIQRVLSNYGREFVGRKIEDVVGKAAADKIAASDTGRLAGEGLEIGGEGMQAFYDSVLPKVTAGVLKKLGGGKIGRIGFVGLDGKGQYRYIDPLTREPSTMAGARRVDNVVEQPGVELTPEIRAAAGAGMPMFSEADGPHVKAANFVNDIVRSSRQFNWWDRTVGTQLHKASKNPWFRRVFERGQAYLQDVSEFASRAMVEAPNILPSLEKLGDIVKMGASQDDLAKIGKAIFTETLDRTLSDEATLRRDFGLDDRQIGFYREARRAINRSLDDLAASEWVRKTRNMGFEAAHAEIHAAPEQARDILTNAFVRRTVDLRKRLAAYEREKGMEDAAQAVRQQMAFFQQLANEITEAAERVETLKAQGYAPLMRFGKYSVHVHHDTQNGGRATDFFGLYETEREANAAARAMREEFGDEFVVDQGIMSEEAWKLFKGVSPDTLEVFAEALGVNESAVFQQYLKLAVNNRSAMKRLIKRHGTPGFSWDTSRVLAAFITSNARRAAGNWHIADMLAEVSAIPRGEGDVKDEAVRLVEYLQNPKEEAAGFRSFLFAQFLGGSIASAAVNLTQPLLMTFPYLQQFGATPAGMMRAAKIAMGSPPKGSPLAAAMDKAAQDGVIAPNEIHQLYAEAIRSLGSNIWVRRFMRAWGSLFAVSEAFNRRLTFAAAYEVAQAQRREDAYDFAVRAVQETQGIYNRGNRPNWARGAVGATVFTFKQFSIAYLEFLSRLPRQQQALALGMLVLAAGLQGLPFADDLDDLIDTLGQSLGYNTSAKRWKRKVLEDAIGPMGAAFVTQGFSALPGVPLDVQARLSVGNLIPGSAVFKRSETDKSRDVLELAGPAGSVVQSGAKALGALQEGRVGAALASLAPVALTNALKGAEMAQMGIYRDTRGRKVIEVDGYDAAIKSIGFQPQKVAQESRRAQEVRQSIAMVKNVESDIAELWATGVFERDPKKVEQARADLIAWNQKNPTTPIRIVPQQVARRVQEMMKTREQRLVKTAPREVRAAVAKELQR